MKWILRVILLLFSLISPAVYAQEHDVEIVLKDRTTLEATLLYVGNDGALIDKHGPRGPFDTVDISYEKSPAQDVTYVSFDSVFCIHKVRTSDAWLIGFPGIPLVFGAAAGFLALRDNDDDMWGAALLMAVSIPLGALVAFVIHLGTSSDVYLTPDNAEDIRTLREHAVYTHNPTRITVLE